MKTLLLLAFVAIANISFSQTGKILSNQDGFEVAYTSQKLSDGNKDKYLVTVTAINRNKEPLYYGVRTTKDGTNIYVSPLSSLFSTKVTVRNATGFLASDGVKIKGEQQDLFTEGRGEQLFKFEVDKIYNYENTINVKKGDTPIITVSHIYQMKPLSKFNIEVSSVLMDGTYKTSCGSVTFGVTLQKQSTRTVLIQSVNGKQIIWVKNTPTSFVKEGDNNSNLTFNKDKSTFMYSTADGVSCEWSKQ